MATPTDATVATGTGDPLSSPVAGAAMGIALMALGFDLFERAVQRSLRQRTVQKWHRDRLRNGQPSVDNSGNAAD